ncbi:SRPBCC family protein [Streptomyces sp. NPDC059861]|uniref:SRPBCC family protein n=1 Tax=Streptomyces sp. NPDC059861 TaxID=3346974 RepID=UPI0036631A38
MEHEVFVPVPPALLGAALADPARVARAVPGLQQEAGAEPVAGRLKVRVGSHSITYRGTVRVTPQDDGSYAVEGDATETRGTGAVKLALTVRLRDTDGGTTLTVQGSASADGRITELSVDTVHSAVTRLLDRTAEKLATDAGQEREEAPQMPAGKQAPAEERQGHDAAEAAAGQRQGSPEVPAEERQAENAAGATAGQQQDDAPEAPTGRQGAAEAPTGHPQEVPQAPAGQPQDDAPEAPAGQPQDDVPEAPAGQPQDDVPEAPAGQPQDVPEAPAEEAPSVFGTEVPPPSLDRSADDPDLADSDADADAGSQGSANAPEPPAEAAHARRTMIGRSAEEVDHAPPRGRYAPVPAPQTVVQNPTLRWAAPAAALVVAGAIVLGRALRRRQ